MCFGPNPNAPRACTVRYVVPLAVATGADPRARYCDGCLVSISAEVVGDWLGAWVTIAAAVSCIGLFIAEMASDAFQVRFSAKVPRKWAPLSCVPPCFILTLHFFSPAR